MTPITDNALIMVDTLLKFYGEVFMSELKPCPFCGSDEIEWQESHAGFSIECYKCDYHVGGDLTLDAVTKLWNSRVNDKQQERIKELESEVSHLSLAVDEISDHNKEAELDNSTLSMNISQFRDSLKDCVMIIEYLKRDGARLATFQSAELCKARELLETKK